MSNLNTVRGMYTAFAKGDIPTIIAALNPEVEWCRRFTRIHADPNRT